MTILAFFSFFISPCSVGRRAIIHTAVGFLLSPCVGLSVLARQTLLVLLAVGTVCPTVSASMYYLLYITRVLPVIAWFAPSSQVAVSSRCECKPACVAPHGRFVVVLLIHPPTSLVGLARADAPEYACAVEVVEFHCVHDALKPSVQRSVWKDCHYRLRLTSSLCHRHSSSSSASCGLFVRYHFIISKAASRKVGWTLWA